MKLCQIKLAGFKSFVEPSTINIEGQLVGIVGPNGCGKSNVIDAVRWVLGESSARQLRGESMQDVIFSGSVKRKPVSRATVELIFDNHDHSLFGLWNNYSEIAIKRLISRQGESSYFINNQQVRRKDITELFLGTGVGNKGYAVIEQGMISRIIESRAEDLRVYLEEAAGVSKYREKRKETLQRLENSAQNLQRLEDLNSELVKQLESLEQQAEVAKLHQDLTKQFNHSQQLILALKITTALNLFAEAEQFIATCQQELKQIQQQTQQLDDKINLNEQHKHQYEQALQDKLAQFNQLHTQLARVEERYKHYSELLQRLETEAANLMTVESEIDFQLTELALNQEHLTEEQEIKQEQLADLLIERENLQQKHQVAYAQLQQFTNQLGQRQQQCLTLEHEIKLIKQDLTHKQAQHQQLKQRQQIVTQELTQLPEFHEVSLLEQEIELIEEQLTELDQQIKDLNLQLDNYRQQRKLLQQQLTTEQYALNASQAKINTFNQLLAPHQQPKQLGVINQQDYLELWQLITVTPNYEKAVEAALNHLLRAIIVETKHDLIAPEYKLSIWLSDNSKIKTLNNITNSLANFVTVKDERVNNLIPHLYKYQILTQLEERNQLTTDQIGVTLTGHIVTNDYIYFNAYTEADHLLQYQQQLTQEELKVTELTIKCDELSLKIDDLAQIEASLTANLTELSSQLARTNHNLQHNKLELIKAEQRQYQVKQDLVRLHNEQQALSQQITQLEQQVYQIEQQALTQENLLIELRLPEADLAVEQFDLEQMVSQAVMAVDSCNNQIERTKTEIKLLQQQQINLTNLMHDKKVQLNNSRQKLAQLTNEREAFNAQNQEQEINNLQQQIQQITLELDDLRHNLDSVVNQSLDLKNQLSTLHNSRQRYQDKINQTQLRHQEQLVLLSTYREQVDTLQLNETELLSLVSTSQVKLSLAELTQQSKLFEAQINELGLVNLKAISDLEQAQQKQQQLFSQLDDLHQAIDLLQTAINHIDEESRELLQTTFSALNQSVAVYFRILFGGGDARLALTDSDILTAGVQIFAQPPGKKNTTIHLLSGGEKALAAMSFVFALFSLNPAPFCLLDEVDAPLDDANTQRFCNLVTELAAKTQFVYISHNRLAMEMATQLVGVTMQEKGVSQIVSVSLVDALSHVNHGG